MIIIATAPQACPDKKFTINFIDQNTFIESMRTMSEAQDNEMFIRNVDDAIYYFNGTFSMTETIMITKEHYIMYVRQWHESVELAAQHLGWHE